jgi:hypothetical protein
MTEITITCPKGKTQHLMTAIEWCDQNFGAKAWKLEHTFPSLRYLFRFDDPAHASLFALKWHS